jgi:hypothetical protein
MICFYLILCVGNGHYEVACELGYGHNFILMLSLITHCLHGSLGLSLALPGRNIAHNTLHLFFFGHYMLHLFYCYVNARSYFIILRYRLLY